MGHKELNENGFLMNYGFASRLNVCVCVCTFFSFFSLSLQCHRDSTCQQVSSSKRVIGIGVHRHRTGSQRGSYCPRCCVR